MQVPGYKPPRFGTPQIFGNFPGGHFCPQPLGFETVRRESGGLPFAIKIGRLRLPVSALRRPKLFSFLGRGAKPLKSNLPKFFVGVPLEVPHHP